MIVKILLGTGKLFYYFPGEVVVEEPAYPFLEQVSPINESTSAESGSAQVVLSLLAFKNLGLPLGKGIEIYNKGALAFSGVVADITIAASITIQIEA